MIAISKNLFIKLTFLLFIATNYCVYAENNHKQTIAISDKEILDKVPEFEKIIKEGLKKIRIPGAILSISRGDKILYSNGFGKTAIDGYEPQNVDTKTLFPISSLSKTVTAILVGALVDDKKIAFEDKVRKYYPEFFICNEELSNKFTIQDLISHSSGLKHFTADSLLKSNYDNDKILRSLRYFKQKPGEFRKYYGYQNIVYGIIGIVIERATGEKYEDLVQKYVFDKMDMRSSSAIRLDAEKSTLVYCKYLLSRFSHDCKRNGVIATLWNFIKKIFSNRSRNISDLHSRYGDEIVHLDHNNFFHKFPATSGISFSAEDFSKWLSMLANRGTYKGKQIVSTKTFDKLTSHIVKVKEIKDADVTFVKERFLRENMYYGMGFFSAKYNDKNILFHMGGIRGATSFFTISLEDNIAIGVACNLGGVSTTRFAEYAVNAISDCIFGYSGIDWIQKEVGNINFYRNKSKNFVSNVINNEPIPQLQIEKYVGKYESEIYGKIEISTNGDQLIISNGIKTAKLTHVNGNVFSIKGYDMLESFFDSDEFVIFYDNGYGNIAGCRLTYCSENDTVFKKK